MSKIVCEICGTSYPDTATNCPICGWGQKQAAAAEADMEDFDLDFLKDDVQAPEEPQDELFDDAPAVPAPIIRKPRPAAPVEEKKGKDIFDYDAVNAAKQKNTVENEDDDEDEDEDEEEESRPNTFLIVILVLLIVALLATSGYIFWKYYLPGRNADNGEAAATTGEIIETVPEVEETVPEVPCTGLSLISGMEKLSYEGQNWLLHVKASPEDTTDVITFRSEDESVAVVNEEGRVTAVGEGETQIIITCGEQVIPCVVTVNYTEETEPVEETTEAPAETEAVEETKAEETPAETEASAPKDGIVLKLKLTDITFGIRGVYRTLVLDCDLKPEDCEWSVRDTNVASVTKNGDVYAVGPGLTIVTCKYGNQTAECIVRCNF